MHPPRLLITHGDVAGIGPEIIAKAWRELLAFGSPSVVGDPAWMRHGLDLIGSSAQVVPIRTAGDVNPSNSIIPVVTTKAPDLSGVTIGHVSSAAGRAAYDFLAEAIHQTQFGNADAIVTCPLHKEGLRGAGLSYPGHTEILAELTHAPRHAMLLHGDGITVAHVTLHMSLRKAVDGITTRGVRDCIDLLVGIIPQLGRLSPRIGVCALNPHASDGGLFGDEEASIVAPAVAAARAEGIDAVGPLPADALWVKAAAGDFDGVVALYHDEGHIPMKMRSGRRLVNITAGLPIVRTSVAHGTAYDIAGRSLADPTSLIEAARIAARLALARRPGAG
ncbi:MAG: 4-hydroxythreonine-4-phosphate dehydrogenase PdxA [Gemmataceae bacterium]